MLVWSLPFVSLLFIGMYLMAGVAGMAPMAVDDTDAAPPPGYGVNVWARTCAPHWKPRATQPVPGGEWVLTGTYRTADGQNKGVSSNAGADKLSRAGVDRSNGAPFVGGKYGSKENALSAGPSTRSLFSST